jgi:hypothetical protein
MRKLPRLRLAASMLTATTAIIIAVTASPATADGTGTPDSPNVAPQPTLTASDTYWGT